jgi:predicted N-acetyltransferase YhbS
MELRAVKPEDYEAVRRLLSEAGWEQRVSDPLRFRRMMENADRTVVACDDSSIVGFARALCDEASNGYISMVAVDAHWRGQGIGRKMVEYLMGDDRNITWVLRAGRGSEGFWGKMGFKSSEVAMERVREN